MPEPETAGIVDAEFRLAVAGCIAAARSENPYHVYLARLAAGSRPAMADALLARMASGGRLDPEALPWHQLRYQHTQAIRQRLVETVSERTEKALSPASVNKALPALRGVLREAWRLGLMSAEDLARPTDLAPVRGSSRWERAAALSFGGSRPRRSCGCARSAAARPGSRSSRPTT